jgi:hypothetical protein
MTGYLALLTSGFAVFWTGLFYLFAWTYPCWSRNLPQSSKEHENSRWWSAWQASGTVHAILASAIALPAMFRLLMADDQIRFLSTDNIQWCVPDENEAEYNLLQEAGLVNSMTEIATVGLMFTVFTTVDLFVALIHGLAGMDYIIHHVAFVLAGIILRSNCILPFNAAILISMELSNLPLNYMSFFRHREGFDLSVKISSAIFAISFFTFRILLNTYGTVVLLWREDVSLPVRVPAWQRCFLLMALGAGALLQFWWGSKVIQAVVKAHRRRKPTEEHMGYKLLDTDAVEEVNTVYQPPTLLGTPAPTGNEKVAETRDSEPKCSGFQGARSQRAQALRCQ